MTEVCDGVVDCGDSSDEPANCQRNCTSKKCDQVKSSRVVIVGMKVKSS
jgi:hypothetical protein